MKYFIRSIAILTIILSLGWVMTAHAAVIDIEFEPHNWTSHTSDIIYQNNTNDTNDTSAAYIWAQWDDSNIGLHNFYLWTNNDCTGNQISGNNYVYPNTSSPYNYGIETFNNPLSDLSLGSFNSIEIKLYDLDLITLNADYCINAANSESLSSAEQFFPINQHQYSTSTTTSTSTPTQMTIVDDPTRNLFYAYVLFFTMFFGMFYIWNKFRRKGGD